jgi:uncharacterized RDD family membrane protein YckC
MRINAKFFFLILFFAPLFMSHAEQPAGGTSAESEIEDTTETEELQKSYMEMDGKLTEGEIAFIPIMDMSNPSHLAALGFELVPIRYRFIIGFSDFAACISLVIASCTISVVVTASYTFAKNILTSANANIFELSKEQSSFVIMIGIMAFLSLSFLYYVHPMTSSTQATPAGYYAGVKVVNREGGKLTPKQAFWRFMISLINIFFFWITCPIAAYWSPNNQMIQDWVGSYVVRKIKTKEEGKSDELVPTTFSFSFMMGKKKQPEAIVQ